MVLLRLLVLVRLLLVLLVLVVVLLLLRVLLLLVVLQVLLVVVARIGAGAVEVVLVDEVVLVVLGGGRGRGKPVGAKVVARQVLAVVVGRGVVDVLRLVAAATLLNFIEKEILVGQREYHLLHTVPKLLHDSLVLAMSHRVSAG